MAEKTIKHLGFWYMEEIEDRFHPGETYWVERSANQGDTVDIQREEDIQRGEEADAFMTDDDIAAQEEAAKLEAEEDEERRRSQLTASEQVTLPTEDLETEEADPRDMSDEELVAWIREDKPTAREVVDAAEGDPEMARRLLDAEDEASEGDSRKSVINGLTHIISNG